MSRQVFIPNNCTIFGTVEKKVENDKAVTLLIDAGETHPRIVVFNSARKYTDNLDEGTFVKCECTIQETKGPKKGFGPRTIACNRITVVDEREPFAKFSIFGRPITTNRVAEDEAFAIVKCVAKNGKSNYIRLNFYGTEAETDEFMLLTPDNFVNFRGEICTSSPRTNYRDDLWIETYKNTRPMS